MARDAVRYFMGDLYADDTGIGFVVTDRSGQDADPTIDEVTVRAIIAAAGASPEATLSPVNLFEITEEEFALVCEAEISIPGLPEGLTISQVKR